MYGHSPSHYTNFMGYCITDEGNAREARDEIELSQEQMIENARKIIAETLLKDNQGNEPALIMPDA